jgi:hypothetical protein
MQEFFEPDELEQLRDLFQNSEHYNVYIDIVHGVQRTRELLGIEDDLTQDIQNERSTLFVRELIRDHHTDELLNVLRKLRDDIKYLSELVTTEVMARPPEWRRSISVLQNKLGFMRTRVVVLINVLNERTSSTSARNARDQYLTNRNNVRNGSHVYRDLRGQYNTQHDELGEYNRQLMEDVRHDRERRNRARSPIRPQRLFDRDSRNGLEIPSSSDSEEEDSEEDTRTISYDPVNTDTNGLSTFFQSPDMDALPTGPPVLTRTNNYATPPNSSVLYEPPGLPGPPRPHLVRRNGQRNDQRNDLFEQAPQHSLRAQPASDSNIRGRGKTCSRRSHRSRNTRSKNKSKPCHSKTRRLTKPTKFTKRNNKKKQPT